MTTTKPDPAVVELARGLLYETLYGKPPLESTMKLAEEIVRLDNIANAPASEPPKPCGTVACYSCGARLHRELLK